MKCMVGKVAGFTLVELLVALLLATLILSGVSAFFASNHQTQLAVKQQLTQQEQERFASYLLTTSLQSACYSGCVALNEGLPVINHALATEQQLASHHCITILAAGDSRLPAFLQGKALQGSDILWWHQASVASVALKNSVVTGEQQLIVDDTIKFNAGEAIVIGDCHQIELFSLTAVEDMPATASQRLMLNAPLTHSYTNGVTTVSELISRAFYVGASGRHHHDGSIISALYWQSYGGDREELVDDMNDLTAVRNGRLINIAMQFNDDRFYLTVPLRESV